MTYSLIVSFGFGLAFSDFLTASAIAFFTGSGLPSGVSSGSAAGLGEAMAAGIPVAVTCSFFLGTLVAPRITVAFDVPDGLTAAAMDADMGEPDVPVGLIPAAAAMDADMGEPGVPVGFIPAAAA